MRAWVCGLCAIEPLCSLCPLSPLCPWCVFNVHLKGVHSGPLLSTGEVSLPFLAGLLLPALGFLRHCLLSPPSCGCVCESADDLARWLPPGTRTRDRRPAHWALA